MTIEALLEPTVHNFEATKVNRTVRQILMGRVPYRVNIRIAAYIREYCEVYRPGRRRNTSSYGIAILKSTEETGDYFRTRFF